MLRSYYPFSSTVQPVNIELFFFIVTITNWSKMLPEFKKVPDQEKLQQFKLLLRAYQGEIDAITKREKATAQAFLTVYNALGQAPDPAKLLQVAAVSPCCLDPQRCESRTCTTYCFACCVAFMLA